MFIAINSTPSTSKRLTKNAMEMDFPLSENQPGAFVHTKKAQAIKF